MRVVVFFGVNGKNGSGKKTFFVVLSDWFFVFKIEFMEVTLQCRLLFAMMI